MLYYTFREVVEKLEGALKGLVSVATPSPDEWTKEAKEFLPKLKDAHVAIEEILKKLPEELSEYKDRRFGPRVEKIDIQSILSVVSTLATDSKLPQAIYSYNPAKLYRTGSLFIACTIELYWGLQKYSLGEYKTQPGQIPALLAQVDNNGAVTLDSLLSVQAEFVNGLKKGAEWDFGNDIEQF
jgi:hypothetical protein